MVATPPPLVDFPDSFSPILVKDLRRLLKGKRFTRAFMYLQVSLLSLTVASYFGWIPSESMNLLFWGSVFLSCATSLKECNHAKSEDTGKNFELIRVSGISPWQFIFGKWCSVNLLQSLLLVSTMPYVVFRYTTSSTNLLAELLALVVIAWLLAFSSSVSLGYSGSNAVAERGLITLFVIGLFAGCIYYLANAGSAIFSWATVCALVVSALFAVVFPLWVGAARLDDSPRNYSVGKRCFALACMLVIGGLTLLPYGYGFKRYLAGAILIWAIADGFFEPTARLSVVLRAFRHSVFTKLSAFFLVSGWPSALLFGILGGVVWLVIGRFSSDSIGILLCTLVLASFLVVPACVAYSLADRSATVAFTVGMLLWVALFGSDCLDLGAGIIEP